MLPLWGRGCPCGEGMTGGTACDILRPAAWPGRAEAVQAVWAVGWGQDVSAAAQARTHAAGWPAAAPVSSPGRQQRPSSRTVTVTRAVGAVAALEGTGRGRTRSPGLYFLGFCSLHGAQFGVGWTQGTEIPASPSSPGRGCKDHMKEETPGRLPG